jgi:hypothetical protein
MQSCSSVLSKRLFALYGVSAVAAIFYLPYFFPQTPSASSSWLFGYNNNAGIALLLLFVAIGAFWARGLGLTFRSSADSARVSYKTLAVSLIATVSGCVVMYFFAHRFGGFGESTYEIDRVWLTSQGKLPYVDFEWPYGVALLYGPLTFVRFFSLDLIQASYLFWCLNCLLGVWLLFLVVNRVNYPSSQKKSIFLLLYCAWFIDIVTMGTKYTLTRYTLPLYFMLLFHKQVQRDTIPSRVFGSVQVLIFSSVLFLYSPEVAIAFVLGSMALFVFLAGRRNLAFFSAFAALLIGLGVLFWVALRLHVLDTTRAFEGGANSFPIILSPHILLFFAALFVCACYVDQRLTRRSLEDNSIALIVFSLPMLAAALGRCDPGHVFLNGLGIFMASLFYASGHKIAWKYSKITFAAILIALSSVSALWLYFPFLAKCGLGLMSARGGNSGISNSLRNAGNSYIDHFAPPDRKEKWRHKLDAILEGDDTKSADLTAMYPGWHGGYLAPFGYKPNGFGTKLTTQIDYGHYEDLINTNTRAANAEKLSEIRNNSTKALLLQDQYESFTPGSVRVFLQDRRPRQKTRDQYLVYVSLFQETRSP